MMLAADLAAALGGRRIGAGWVARCPAHDDQTPSLSIANGEGGRLLLHCFAGCAFESVAAALQEAGVSIEVGTSFSWPSRNSISKSLSRDVNRRRLAMTCWRRTCGGESSPVERYLRSRAISGSIPRDLRFAQALRHPSGVFGRAMVAAIRSRAGCLVGVHRTWLCENGCGKADLDPAKAMLGLARGGAVRLGGDYGPLVVAEGIETALSLRDALGEERRVWAALSTSGVAGLELPSEAGELTCAPDGDAPGRAAAKKLAERALRAGWTVRIMAAPEGRDWNDVARDAAAEERVDART